MRRICSSLMLFVFLCLFGMAEGKAQTSDKWLNHWTAVIQNVNETPVGGQVAGWPTEHTMVRQDAPPVIQLADVSPSDVQPSPLSTPTPSAAVPVVAPTPSKQCVGGRCSGRVVRSHHKVGPVRAFFRHVRARRSR